eukprot:5320088-Amphidinium_carterae.1
MPPCIVGTDCSLPDQLKVKPFDLSVQIAPKNHHVMRVEYIERLLYMSSKEGVGLHGVFLCRSVQGKYMHFAAIDLEGGAEDTCGRATVLNVLYARSDAIHDHKSASMWLRGTGAYFIVSNCVKIEFVAKPCFL